MTRSVTLPNGVTLEYVERGRASGVPMIFLHGVTDSGRAFEPVLDRLPDTIHAWSITQRGHGGSSKPDEGDTYADMAEDVREFMDVFALPSAVIVGHSMGSMAAQRFAASHPDRVAGLVLIGASTPDRSGALASVTAPTLLASGDEDPDRFVADLIAFVYERHNMPAAGRF